MHSFLWLLMWPLLCCFGNQSLSNKQIVKLLQREPDEVIDVLTCDKAWESKFDYATILKIDSCYVMYYRTRTKMYCRAVSKDGIHWDKPNIDKIEYKGSMANNIVLNNVDGVCVEYVDGVYWMIVDRQYVDNTQKRGVVLYSSKDGIYFEKYERFNMPFFCDSQNEIMWDSTSKTFKFYLRSWYKSEKTNIDYHHTHQLYRSVSLFETATLDTSIMPSLNPLLLAGKSEPPSLSNELPVIIDNFSEDEDFDIYCSYVHKYRDNLYIAYPINYYHTDDLKRGGENKNDGYATIGFWTSKDGRKFKEVKRDYMVDGENWMEFCIGHVETDNAFIHYYISFNGTHSKQTGKNTIKARIHYKNRLKKQ